MIHFPLLQAALAQYDLDTETLVLEQELPANWHGDLHLKIRIADVAHSARFYHENRYDKSVSTTQLTDEQLREQFRFIDLLRAHDIPFMPYVTTQAGEPFANVQWEGQEYRFLLFRWLEGVHLTHGTPTIAEKMGQMTRRYHDVSVKFESDLLPYHDSKVLYAKYLQLLRETATKCELASEDRALLEEYLGEIETHIALGFPTDVHPPRKEQYIYASDLNNLNILWNEQETITGIIDFEHISATDRISELAWMVKWYSRTQGIYERHEMSPANAAAFLQGYGAYELLDASDLNRLPSLLWLSGCLNWNFTAKTRDILQGTDDTALAEHLANYHIRGEKLCGLCNEQIGSV